jgi:nitrate/nitrite transporter NarK
MTSRVIEGIGIGLIGVVAPATIAMWFPPERQGGPMGIWATWVPVGTVVMYLLAPALAAWQGLPAVWWFGAGFAVLMFAAYAVFVRRPPAQQAGNGSAPELLDLRNALANRNIWLLALEFGCFNLALVSLGTYYPTFLNEVRGLALGQAAFVASIGTMIVLLSAPLAGWFSDRIGSRRLVFSLPFLALAALLVFPFRVEGGAIVAVMIVQGLIAGAVPTATFAAAPEVMRRPQWAGLGLAVVLIGQNLGQLVGPVLFGRLVDSLGWIPAGNLLIGVCLVGFVSAWLVKMR